MRRDKVLPHLDVFPVSCMPEQGMCVSHHSNDVFFSRIFSASTVPASPYVFSPRGLRASSLGLGYPYPSLPSLACSFNAIPAFPRTFHVFSFAFLNPRPSSNFIPNNGNDLLQYTVEHNVLTHRVVIGIALVV